MSKKKNHVRFGLYGCGAYRTKNLTDAAEKSDDCNVSISACFDIDRERVDAAAKMHNANACYDLESFLKADYDVALISLPPYLHPDAFVACAEAGRDIYMEKPVCVDDAGEKKLIDAMKKYNPVCYVGISSPYIPPLRKALEIRRRADAGPLTGFHHHRLAPLTGEKRDFDNWRFQLNQSGGELNQHCCHDMHYLRLVCGEPESVMAMSYTSPDYRPSFEEEELTACFRLKQGMAVFQFSQRSHCSKAAGYIHLQNMAIQYEWESHSNVKVYKDRPRAAEETYEYDSSLKALDNESSAFLQTKDFLQAYINGNPMPITLSDGLQAYRMTRAIRESYKNKCEVAIPMPDTF